MYSIFVEEAMEIYYETAEILQRLKTAIKADTWKEVADFLGVKEGTLSAWRVNNRQACVDKILRKGRDVASEQWLIHGVGEEGGGQVAKPAISAPPTIIERRHTPPPQPASANRPTETVSAQLGILCQFISESYGEEPADVYAFLQDQEACNHRYRLWLHEKKMRKSGGDMAAGGGNLQATG
jgi:hypothetical protein